MHLPLFRFIDFDSSKTTKNNKKFELKCEKPEKHWVYYSEQELMAYMMRNASKADCSFIIIDPTGRIPQKAVESFQWILCDISPVLQAILNDKINRKNNCQCIQINDSNFESVLTYAHTKSIEPYKNLLDLLRSANKFEIVELKKHIAYTIDRDWTKFRTTFGWKNIFQAAYFLKEDEPELSRSMWKFIKQLKFENMEEELESSIEDINNFDFNLFRDFFELLKLKGVSPLQLLKIIEANIIKNVLNGNAPNSGKNIGNQTRDIFQYFLKQIDFSALTSKEFIEGTENSQLLNETMKSGILTKISNRK